MSTDGDTVHFRLTEALAAHGIDPDTVTMETPNEWLVAGDVEIIIEVVFDGNMNETWYATRRDDEAREDSFASGELESVASAVAQVVTR